MTEQEIRLLKEAILHEYDGYEYYKYQSTQWNDKVISDNFKALAEEEQIHAKWLEKYFDNHKEQFDQREFNLLKDVKPPGIFDWSNLSKFSETQLVDVIEKAMDMEKASVEHYRNAKLKAGESQLNELYDLLIQWETAHYVQLKGSLEKTREKDHVEISTFFENAIKIEIDGANFYENKASSVKSIKLRELFSYFANEEKRHIKWLEGMLLALQSNKDIYPIDTVDFVIQEPIEWDQYLQKDDEEIKEVVKEALAIEKESINFYIELLKKTKSTIVEIVATSLLEWEEEHLKEFEDFANELMK